MSQKIECDMMDIEDTHILEKNEEVEVRRNKAYNISQNVLIRYIIEFKLQQFSNYWMIIDVNIKNHKIQFKLTKKNEEVNFKRIEFLDKVNAIMSLDDLIVNTQTSIEYKEMYSITKQFISKVIEDAAHRYFNLSNLSQKNSSTRNKSSEIKPKNNIQQYLISIFSKHKYFSTSQEPSQENYQFLYVMQTDLVLPYYAKQTIIKIGKTIQKIQKYCKDLINQYDNKINFEPLIYFEIPCDSQESTIVDKCIHNMLNREKSENKIFIQGVKNLHQEFFLLDKSLIDVMRTVLFSDYYLQPYKKQNSQIINAQSTKLSFNNLSQINQYNEDFLADDSVLAELNKQIQITSIQQQKNSFPIQQQDEQITIFESQIPSQIKSSNNSKETVKAQKNSNFNQPNQNNKQQEEYNQNIKNYTPQQGEVSYYQDGQKQQQEDNKNQKVFKIQQSYNKFFINLEEDKQKILAKGNFQYQDQLLKNDQNLKNKPVEMTSMLSGSNQQQNNKNNTFEIRQQPLSDKDYLSKNQTSYGIPQKNIQNQNHQTQYQQPEQLIDDGDKLLSKYKSKYQAIEEMNLQNQDPSIQYQVPSAPLPPNTTYYSSQLTQGQDNTKEDLMKLLDQLTEFEQNLKGLNKEIQNKYDQILQI